MQTETTRRALFGGAGLAAIAVAVPAIAAQNGVTAVDADPLEPFARAWLARWTHLGGTYAHDLYAGGGWMLGWPEYDLSPIFYDDRAAHGWTDDGEHYRAYAHARYDGQMRALRELLDSVAGGNDAVKALVTEDPGLGHMRARKVVA